MIVRVVVVVGYDSDSGRVIVVEVVVGYDSGSGSVIVVVVVERVCLAFSHSAASSSAWPPISPIIIIPAMSRLGQVATNR